MKIAQHLATFVPSFAASEAEKRAVAKDQIWDGDGYTKYTFDDNSILVQSSVLQFGIDADDADSIKKYASWLGNDISFEQKEIDRLLEALAADNNT